MVAEAYQCNRLDVVHRFASQLNNYAKWIEMLKVPSCYYG